MPYGGVVEDKGGTLGDADRRGVVSQSIRLEVVNDFAKARSKYRTHEITIIYLIPMGQGGLGGGIVLGPRFPQGSHQGTIHTGG